jgi:hypothetical protein
MFEYIFYVITLFPKETSAGPKWQNWVYPRSGDCRKSESSAFTKYLKKQVRFLHSNSVKKGLKQLLPYDKI